MKKIVFFVVILIIFFPIAKIQSQTNAKKQIVPGEQAPPADPGQRNFGGFIPPVGQKVKQPPMMRKTRPEPEISTVSLDEISISDPFIFPDDNTGTYYLTGTGGRLYISEDLKMWAGPYPAIDLAGT
jgi:hypothetical protein